MDLDLDLFSRRDDRDRRRWRDDDDEEPRRRRGRRWHDDGGERDDDRERRVLQRAGDRDHHRRRDRDVWYSRRAHPHLFSWLLLGGGVVLLGLALIALASSLGLWSAIAGAYFAVSEAVLPASWHDEWRALPGVVHVGIVLGALFVAAGAAGELLD